MKDWKELAETIDKVAAEAFGFRVEFAYWEDSILGGFYDPDRPGDIPTFHLVVYDGVEEVLERATLMEIGTPWRTVFYWAEKILKALEKKSPLEAAAVCPFVQTAQATDPEKEAVSV